MKRNLYLCVQQDIAPPVNAGLRDFSGVITVKSYPNTAAFLRAFLEEPDAMLIFDQYIGQESTINMLAEIKKRLPGMKILLVVSGNTSKAEIASIITSRIASAILVRPFSLDQLATNVYKLLGQPKPEDSPWYKHGQ
jgi:DNA-binding NtrC family response regulator